MQIDFKLVTTHPVENVVPKTDFVVSGEDVSTGVIYTFGFDASICRVAGNGLDTITDDISDYFARDASVVIQSWFSEKGIATSDYALIIDQVAIADVVQRKLKELGDNPPVRPFFDNQDHSGDAGVEPPMSKDLPFGTVAITFSDTVVAPLGDVLAFGVSGHDARIYTYGITFTPSAEALTGPVWHDLAMTVKIIAEEAASLIKEYQDFKGVYDTEFSISETELETMVLKVMEALGAPRHDLVKKALGIESAFCTVSFVDEPTKENIKTIDDFPDSRLELVDSITGLTKDFYVKLTAKPIGRHDEALVINQMAGRLEEYFSFYNLVPPSGRDHHGRSGILTAGGEKVMVDENQTTKSFFLGLARHFYNMATGNTAPWAGQIKDRIASFSLRTQTTEVNQQPRTATEESGAARLCLTIALKEGLAFQILYNDEIRKNSVVGIYGTVTFRGERRVFRFGMQGAPMRYVRMLPEEYIINMIREGVAETLAVYGMEELVDIKSIKVQHTVEKSDQQPIIAIPTGTLFTYMRNPS